MIKSGKRPKELITLYTRKDEGDYISLWRVQNGKEEIVAKDIKLSEYSWYYGHSNLESSLDIYVS